MVVRYNNPPIDCHTEFKYVQLTDYDMYKDSLVYPLILVCEVKAHR